MRNNRAVVASWDWTQYEYVWGLNSAGVPGHKGSAVLHSVFPGWCKDPFFLFLQCNVNPKRKHASDPRICIAMDQVKRVVGVGVGDQKKKKKNWRKVKPFCPV